MKKLKFILLLIPFMFLSCSKDSDSTETPVTYSVLGLWKTTSAVLNGVEKIGGTNPVKSELTYFNTNGTFRNEGYSDANYTTLSGYATGTFTIPTTSTINMIGNAYNASNTLLTSYNLNWEVVSINATELQVKVRNYPAANDVYVKKFTK